jgi:hypothetical protein
MFELQLDKVQCSLGHHRMVQAVVRKGAHGQSALQVLGKHLREANQVVGSDSSVAGLSTATADTMSVVPTVHGNSEAVNDEVLTMVEQAILQSGTPLGSSSKAQVYATLHASTAPSGSKRMCLMTDAEATAAQQHSKQDAAQVTRNVSDRISLSPSAMAASGQGNKASKNLCDATAAAVPILDSVLALDFKGHYVKVIARLCEIRLKASGVGSLQVLQHGNILQLGDSSIRARFRPINGQTARQCGNTRHVDDTSRWTWEVLWGGGDGEAQDVLHFVEAIMSAAGSKHLNQLSE